MLDETPSTKRKHLSKEEKVHIFNFHTPGHCCHATAKTIKSRGESCEELDKEQVAEATLGSGRPRLRRPLDHKLSAKQISA